MSQPCSEQNTQSAAAVKQKHRHINVYTGRVWGVTGTFVYVHDD